MPGNAIFKPASIFSMGRAGLLGKRRPCPFQKFGLGIVERAEFFPHYQRCFLHYVVGIACGDLQFGEFVGCGDEQGGAVELE